MVTLPTVGSVPTTAAAEPLAAAASAPLHRVRPRGRGLSAVASAPPVLTGVAEYSRREMGRLAYIARSMGLLQDNSVPVNDFAAMMALTNVVRAGISAPAPSPEATLKRKRPLWCSHEDAEHDAFLRVGSSIRGTEAGPAAADDASGDVVEPTKKSKPSEDSA